MRQTRAMRIDLHVHSSVSDGTDTPTRLVLNAVTAGLDVIGLTDHDTFDGIMEAVGASKRSGIKILPGIEMSCEKDGKSVHLLGYGCDPYHQPLLEELARIRVGRTGRIQAMLDKLAECGCPLTMDDVMGQVGASPVVGRPHIADALVAKGYVSHRDEAFDKYLGDDKPGYVHRYACPLEQAIDLIHDAKGAAVLAHPWGRGRENVLPAAYLEKLVAEHGLEGIEVDHQDHDDNTRELLSGVGYRLGLIRTGSSDYHGLGKRDHELGCNTTRVTAYNELLRRIRLRGGTVPA